MGQLSNYWPPPNQWRRRPYIIGRRPIYTGMNQDLYRYYPARPAMNADYQERRRQAYERWQWESWYYNRPNKYPQNACTYSEEQCRCRKCQQAWQWHPHQYRHAYSERPRPATARERWRPQNGYYQWTGRRFKKQRAAIINKASQKERSTRRTEDQTAVKQEKDLQLKKDSAENKKKSASAVKKDAEERIGTNPPSTKKKKKKPTNDTTTPRSDSSLKRSSNVKVPLNENRDRTCRKVVQTTMKSQKQKSDVTRDSCVQKHINLGSKELKKEVEATVREGSLDSKDRKDGESLPKTKTKVTTAECPHGQSDNTRPTHECCEQTEYVSVAKEENGENMQTGKTVSAEEGTLASNRTITELVEKRCSVSKHDAPQTTTEGNLEAGHSAAMTEVVESLEATNDDTKTRVGYRTAAEEEGGALGAEKCEIQRTPSVECMISKEDEMLNEGPCQEPNEKEEELSSLGLGKPDLSFTTDSASGKAHHPDLNATQTNSVENSTRTFRQEEDWHTCRDSPRMEEDTTMGTATDHPTEKLTDPEERKDDPNVSPTSGDSDVVVPEGEMTILKLSHTSLVRTETMESKAEGVVESGQMEGVLSPADQEVSDTTLGDCLSCSQGSIEQAVTESKAEVCNPSDTEDREDDESALLSVQTREVNDVGTAGRGTASCQSCDEDDESKGRNISSGSEEDMPHQECDKASQTSTIGSNSKESVGSTVSRDSTVSHTTSQETHDVHDSKSCTTDSEKRFDAVESMSSASLWSSASGSSSGLLDERVNWLSGLRRTVATSSSSAESMDDQHRPSESRPKDDRHSYDADRRGCPSGARNLLWKDNDDESMKRRYSWFANGSRGNGPCQNEHSDCEYSNSDEDVKVSSSDLDYSDDTDCCTRGNEANNHGDSGNVNSSSSEDDASDNAKNKRRKRKKRKPAPTTFVFSTGGVLPKGMSSNKDKKSPIVDKKDKNHPMYQRTKKKKKRSLKPNVPEKLTVVSSSGKHTQALTFQQRGGQCLFTGNRDKI